MQIKNKIFRIIDANFNRSREGLRVCEDISRFILNDGSLTKEFKAIRHAISGIIKSSPKVSKLSIESRNAAKDVGSIPLIEIEISRHDAGDIFIANIQRSKESIRVLEEFFKLIDIKGSAKLSKLRFKVYTAEKKAFGKLSCLRSTGKTKKAG